MKKLRGMQNKQCIATKKENNASQHQYGNIKKTLDGRQFMHKRVLCPSFKFTFFEIVSFKVSIFFFYHPSFKSRQYEVMIWINL